MDTVHVKTDGDLPAESQPEEESSQRAAADNGIQAPKRPNVRKRTKTGCLTCRKRRIKCDEGKPTCNNCVKSKRECEGYNQRVVFKEPMSTFHHPGFYPDPIYPPQPPVPLVHHTQFSAPRSKPTSPTGGMLQVIAPKPASVDFNAPPTSLQYSQAFFHGQPGSATTGSFNLSPGQYASQVIPPNPVYIPTDTTPPPAQSQSAKDPVFHFYPTPESRSGAEYRDQSQEVSPVPERTAAPFAAEEPAVKPGDLRDANADVGFIFPPEEEYWYSDDDASMAESDDDVMLQSHNATHLQANDQGIIVARRLDGIPDVHGTGIRTFTPLTDNNMLATYIPSSTNSPLNDTQTAAVFWYFVTVTGPSISLYERHPLDPAPMFQGHPVPKARQHIWTYTFPIISLNHPALLQAMLALGSLQMAKLDGKPPTASMKHYHLSLRRIAKNYQSSTRRTQLATLAATLLLGFYEVWNSDHDKWCKHMSGARAILKEIPLREMTRSIVELKRRRRREQEELRARQPLDGFYSQFDDVLDVDPDDIDTTLLSQLTGHSVSYDEPPGRHGNPQTARGARQYTVQDIEEYESMSDLYWWYCKMDVYQSVLGGTRLFLDYDLWTQVQPRAPIGRIDAIYGTFDHLMLLLGRLANFASLDLARKRKARKAEQPPASQGRGPGLGQGQDQSPPSFPGMLPSKGGITVPAGFSPPREGTSPRSDATDDLDLEGNTRVALAEWESIRQAFEVFRAQLGPDFEPLDPEYEPSQDTPFGPALTYRTFSIAGIWMNYHMGLISLQRSHPSMPPVAMMAAGMAARQTAPWANTIGRIAAGLSGDVSREKSISTLVGAAFIESSFCLFVAGVQYQTPAHRHWTIRRLHDMARLTGWQSARQIANGCESAWTKAAALGKGPPYTRPSDINLNHPPSIWDNPRRIDERIRELDGREEGRLVLAKSEQAHYALGLLGVEQDLERLELRDRG